MARKAVVSPHDLATCSSSMVDIVNQFMQAICLCHDDFVGDNPLKITHRHKYFINPSPHTIAQGSVCPGARLSSTARWSALTDR